MRTTGQSLTIGVAILLAAIPVFWLFLATWNAIDGVISMPRLFLDWASAYAAWWLGFLATLVFARRCSTRGERPWKRWGLLLPIAVGLSAIAWLEIQSWHDAKQVFPPGFFFAPYVISIGAGWVVRMLSNNTPHPDARGAASQIQTTAGARPGGRGR